MSFNFHISLDNNEVGRRKMDKDLIAGRNYQRDRGSA
jgi:hypothetical protein